MLLRVGNTMSKRWPRNDFIFLVLLYANDSVKDRQDSFDHPRYKEKKKIHFD